MKLERVLPGRPSHSSRHLRDTVGGRGQGARISTCEATRMEGGNGQQRIKLAASAGSVATYSHSILNTSGFTNRDGSKRLREVEIQTQSYHNAIDCYTIYFQINTCCQSHISRKAVRPSPVSAGLFLPAPLYAAISFPTSQDRVPKDCHCRIMFCYSTTNAEGGKSW